MYGHLLHLFSDFFFLYPLSAHFFTWYFQSKPNCVRGINQKFISDADSYDWLNFKLLQNHCMYQKFQAFSQDWTTPSKLDLLDPNSGCFESCPINPPSKIPILTVLVAKSGPLGRFCMDFGSHLPPPRATGLRNSSTLLIVPSVIPRLWSAL